MTLPLLDATSVIATAKQLIISSNYLQVENARATVFATLEQHATDPSSIALWLAFAELEMELRQFKQATKVFEMAVSKWPASIELWKRYVSFCLDREKFSNAKKLVMRALDLLPSTEHETLWSLLVACPATQGDVESLRGQRKAAETNGSVAQNEAPKPLIQPQSSEMNASTPATVPAPIRVSKFDMVAKPEPVPEMKYFDDIPMTLPVIPECKYLLFDPVDPSVNVPAPVLQMLSELLRDNNEQIFKVVVDMALDQRKQDIATLYRWQDLIGMQMKEGSDLCQRHHATPDDESKAPRELIERQTLHLQQRNEFTSRCTMAQQQFIDVQGMTRKATLLAQQRALQDLRIPLMLVTDDPEMIAQQRKMTALIMEAEAVWRVQNPRPAEVPKPAPTSYDRYPSRSEPPSAHSKPEESRFQSRRQEPPPMRQSSFGKPSHQAPSYRQDISGPPPSKFSSVPPPEYRQAPPSHDYRGPSQSMNHDYRGGSAHDHRPGPSQDYRQGPSQDYRQGPPQDYRQVPPAQDYRQGPPQDYRQPPPQDYRQPSPQDYRPAHDHRAPQDYRQGPPQDYRQAPPQDYRQSAPPTQNYQPPPQYGAPEPYHHQQRDPRMMPRDPRQGSFQSQPPAQQQYSRSSARADPRRSPPSSYSSQGKYGRRPPSRR